MLPTHIDLVAAPVHLSPGASVVTLNPLFHKLLRAHQLQSAFAQSTRLARLSLSYC
jgi:hypothetical protein